MSKFLFLTLALVSFGFAAADAEPVFKSPRKFYRPGDTIQVSIERDTTLEVAFCTAQRQATIFYKIEKQEGDVWNTVYNTTSVCRTNMPATMTAGKGFTIKHMLLDEGRFRVVVSGQYISSEFELK
jgi:hypothetical protein